MPLIALADPVRSWLPPADGGTEQTTLAPVFPLTVDHVQVDLALSLLIDSLYYKTVPLPYSDAVSVTQSSFYFAALCSFVEPKIKETHCQNRSLGDDEASRYFTTRERVLLTTFSTCHYI